MTSPPKARKIKKLLKTVAIKTSTINRAIATKKYRRLNLKVILLTNHFFNRVEFH